MLLCLDRSEFKSSLAEPSTAEILPQGGKNFRQNSNHCNHVHRYADAVLLIRTHYKVRCYTRKGTRADIRQYGVTSRNCFPPILFGIVASPHLLCATLQLYTSCLQFLNTEFSCSSIVSQPTEEFSSTFLLHILEPSLPRF